MRGRNNLKQTLLIVFINSIDICQDEKEPSCKLKTLVTSFTQSFNTHQYLSMSLGIKRKVVTMFYKIQQSLDFIEISYTIPTVLPLWYNFLLLHLNYNALVQHDKQASHLWTLHFSPLCQKCSSCRYEHASFATMWRVNWRRATMKHTNDKVEK